MAVFDRRRQVLVNAAKGVKKVTKVRRFHESLPRDGSFLVSRVDADVDVTDKVCVVEEEHVYRCECGCYVESPYQIVGRCRAGLLVCQDHFQSCPRNARDPGFDPHNAPRLRPCLRRCWFLINLSWFLRWLVTPPKSKEVRHARAKKDS